MGAIKEYFVIAGQIFLMFAAMGAVVGAVFGGVWLTAWVWGEVHPLVAVPVAMALGSLGLAAFFIGDYE